MNEDQRSIAGQRAWRRTERRTRPAREIELEVRRFEGQRARRLGGRGPSYR